MFHDDLTKEVNLEPQNNPEETDQATRGENQTSTPNRKGVNRGGQQPVRRGAPGCANTGTAPANATNAEATFVANRQGDTRDVYRPARQAGSYGGSPQHDRTDPSRVDPRTSQRHSAAGNSGDGSEAAHQY